MKELENKNRDVISIHAQKEVKKELVVDDILNPKNNHIIFEIDLQKKTVCAAKYENSKSVSLFDVNGKNKKLIRKDGCVYISALNFKNVLRKLEKQLINTNGFNLISHHHASGSHLNVLLLSEKQ